MMDHSERVEDQQLIGFAGMPLDVKVRYDTTVFPEGEYNPITDHTAYDVTVTGDGYAHFVGAPAVVLSGSGVLWCNDGYLHREDGPAVIALDDQEWWFYRGVLHRMNGPAIPEGDYYIYGEHVCEPVDLVSGHVSLDFDTLEVKPGVEVPSLTMTFDFAGFTNVYQYLDFGNGVSFEKVYSHSDDSKTATWKKWGVPHRIGEPARVTSTADYTRGEWHRNGKPHREDGPAVSIVYRDETLHRWFLDGVLVDEPEGLENHDAER